MTFVSLYGIGYILAMAVYARLEPHTIRYDSDLRVMMVVNLFWPIVVIGWLSWWLSWAITRAVLFLAKVVRRA